jgi:hypothetical protein
VFVGAFSLFLELGPFHQLAYDRLRALGILSARYLPYHQHLYPRFYADEHRLETIANRNPPFGRKIKVKLPKFRLAVTHIIDKIGKRDQIKVSFELLNHGVAPCDLEVLFMSSRVMVN